MASHDDILVSAQSIGVTLELYEDRLVFNRRGIAAMEGNTVIPLTAIRAINFKAAGFTAGHIVVITGGGKQERVVFGTWPRRRAEAFIALNEAIEERLRHLQSAEASEVPANRKDAGTSGINALERLADMRSKGLLTDEEFVSAKRKLLGL